MGMSDSDDDDQSSIPSMMVDGSIPSVVDGLTPVQRMILIYAFKNPDCQRVKELIAWVDSPAYRNQQQLLTATMTGMAQNYPGTNNINLLNPSGGVGNRYTCTRLSSITRHIFRDLDQPLAECVIYDYYVDDDDRPTWLMPVIPMVLVNGSQRICPKYDPHDIIANLRNLLSNKPFVPMAPLPRYKWFMREIPTSSYTTRGIVEEEKGHAPNTLFITEIPIGMEAQDYEEFLKQAAGLKQTEPFIKEYIAHRDIINGTVTFEVVMSPDQMSKAQEEGFEKKFGLTTDLNTDNIHFLDANGVRKKYDTPERIMKEFFDLRLKCYEERQSALFDIVENALLTLKEELYSPFCNFRESALFPLKNAGDQVRYAWLKKNYLLPNINTLEDVEDQRVYFFKTLLSLTCTLETTCVKEIWLKELDALEEQLNKREEEDETEKRKKCCWKPVVRKRCKTRTTLHGDGDGDRLLRRSNRVPKSNRVLYGGDYVTK